MKSRLLALPVALLDLVAALHLLAPRDTPSVLSLDTQRKRISNPVQHDRLRRRQSTLSASLENEETLYYVNVSLGSPAQSLRLDIDTGSSDLWTNAPSSIVCMEPGRKCAGLGTYDANSSSTYKYVNSDFYIEYVDGTYAAGDYATDTLSIQGQDITGLQFGIGYNSTSASGVLGVGYQSNEAQISVTGTTYPNLPAKLVDQNVIQSNAYSLWLNDLDANTGTILFGGVDTDKFEGTLSTLPIVKEGGQYREFIIALTGLSAAGQSVFNDTSNAVAVLLDSGSSLTYLPDDYAQSVYTAIGADYHDSVGAAIVDCNLAGDSRTVDFTFSGPTISVSMSELVLVVAGSNPHSEVCILGILPAGSSTSVLGDTFLRSAYVVYDLDNNEISLAASTFNVSGSSIREIGTGSSAVPEATLVANAVSTAPVGTGGARNGGLPSGVSAADSIMSRQSMTGVLICATIATMAVTLGAGMVLW